jgi:oligoendopeptidase F
MSAVRFGLAGLLLVLAVAPVRAGERSAVATNYTWNLSDLYADEAAWQAAKDDAAKRIPELAQYEGHLGDSPAKLLAALTAIDAVQDKLERLSSYALLLADQDRRVSHNLELQQETEQLQTKFATATAFVAPEILKIGAAKIDKGVAAEPKLKPYAQPLRDILRRAPHTLSPAEEKLVAQAGDLSGAGQSVHSLFTNAELPFPEVTLSTGDKVRLDNAAYTRWRAATSRADRDLVFHSFWGAYQAYQGTLGVALYEQVKAHMFDKNVHKFDSCVEAALFPFSVPPSVYKQLLAGVHENLPTLHRYLRLRQKLMGVETLRYEDLYAPIIQKVDQSYTPEQAMDLTCKR